MTLWQAGSSTNTFDKLCGWCTVQRGTRPPIQMSYVSHLFLSSDGPLLASQLDRVRSSKLAKSGVPRPVHGLEHGRVPEAYLVWPQSIIFGVT
jgi:hypothetical protein